MLRSYLKLAWRLLWRRKFFTAISLFAIGTTLVVLTVAAALLDHAYAPMPPEVRQQRTLGIFRARFVGPRAVRNGAAGYRLLDRYARNLPGVERLAIISAPSQVTAYPGGVRQELTLRRADAEYWRVLDFQILEGGPFGDQDVANGALVAVISAATRDRFFAGSSALGRSIEADGQVFRVIGVVANVPTIRMVATGDIYVPLSTAKTDAYKREMLGGFFGLLLARSPADFPLIKRELEDRLAAAEMPSREYDRLFAPAETYFEAVAGRRFGGRYEERSRPDRMYAVMAVGALLFLLLPAMNLVSLNISRIMERASEIGVRKAFGASSHALVGQFIVEHLVLTTLGGLIGLALSLAVLRWLSAIAFIEYARLSVNLRVFAYGLGLSLFFGLMSGVYPAWRMSRLHPVVALRGAAS